MLRVIGQILSFSKHIKECLYLEQGGIPVKLLIKLTQWIWSKYPHYDKHLNKQMSY